MKFQFTALAVAVSPLLSLSAPLSSRQQIIPTLPPLDIPTIRTRIQDSINEAFGVDPATREGRYGDFVNTLLPFGETVKAIIGADQVTAIDILADRACIAGFNQGSLCNELLSYAQAWYVAQQNGWTYGFVAQSLGENNMEQIDQALRTACLQPADDVTAQKEGVCQKLSFALDQNANALIQENTGTEDIGNSNSLEYFGLQNILPAPRPLGV